MNKEDFLLDLECSLSGGDYNTTRIYDRIYLINEEMECSIYVMEISNEVLLSHIETKHCLIVPYKHRFIIENYDSVEELADNIIEVVNAYAGTEAKQQKFIKTFIRSMRKHGCRLIEACESGISFKYRGIKWMIEQDFSQAPNDIWCFKNIYSSYLTREPFGSEQLSPWILKFNLKNCVVKDLVEKILHKIDCYL